MKFSKLFIYTLLGAIMSACQSEQKPQNIPREMVWVKGGTWQTQDLATRNPKNVYIKGFLLDKNLVTVADFAKFVQATHYRTEAEKYGNSGVFVLETGAWEMIEGANFRFPQGKNAPAALANHPVTQVSWNDAQAYARWQGKRLPTAYEWEWAASAAGEQTQQYAWGSQLIENQQYKANVWQGNFPENNTLADGFAFTSPVGYFGANTLGLSDMGGNVWQWCQDDIAPNAEEARNDPKMRKVLKGGSFLCDEKVCHGYQIKGLSSSTPETGLMHVGFRCAKEIE
ncbi:MAG: formylglycine-generating enzyme family protein [Microscillaceae bacterium]|jgi:sulfatase modifying factor 1|nr:formylglycine-generating enzyme family protein [Microscillaceae bacterium]